MIKRLTFSLSLATLLLAPTLALAETATSTPIAKPTETVRVKVKAASIKSFSSKNATSLKDANGRLEKYRQTDKEVVEAKDTKVAAERAQKEQQRLEYLNQFGGKQISARLEVINQLKQLPNERCLQLPDDLKGTYLGYIATIEANLKDEQSRLAQVTALADLKTIINEVYTKNRVFMNFSPALAGICASGRLLDLVDQLQGKVKEWQARGADTSALDRSLLAAEESLNQALNIYKGIAQAPSGDSRKVDLEKARALTEAARDSLKTAREQISQIKKDLASR